MKTSPEIINYSEFLTIPLNEGLSPQQDQLQRISLKRKKTDEVMQAEEGGGE